MTTIPDRSPPLRAIRTEPKCAVCSKPAGGKYRPFCSKRCADVDLGRWLKESYRVPTDESPESAGQSESVGDGDGSRPAVSRPGTAGRGTTGQGR